MKYKKKTENIPEFSSFFSNFCDIMHFLRTLISDPFNEFPLIPASRLILTHDVEISDFLSGYPFVVY